MPSPNEQGARLVESGGLPGDWPSDHPNEWISRDEIASLHTIRHGRVVTDIILTWTIILLTLQATILTHSCAIGATAFILIGCLQNALVLWTHEASHYNLSRNKELNDWLSDLFLSGPTGVTVGQYRWQHVRHHRYLGDPQKEIEPLAWICVRSKNLFLEILRHLSGVYGLRVIRRYQKQEHDPRYANLPKRSVASLAGFIMGNGILFGVCAIQGAWYLYFLLWVLPLFTVALLIGNFRTMVEHQPSSDVCDVGLVRIPAITRVVRSGWIARLLIAPVGFYYHFEHHMFPGIPYHRLKEVRRLLIQRGCFEREDIVWADGYVNTIWRLAMKPGYGLRIERTAETIGLQGTSLTR
jgi:fatty acid desaturase